MQTLCIAMKSHTTYFYLHPSVDTKLDYFPNCVPFLLIKIKASNFQFTSLTSQELRPGQLV